MSGVANMPPNNKYFQFTPIAYFNCSKTQNLEASSQGVLDPHATGIIDLQGLPQWSQMISELEGFSHLWVIFVFHRTEGQWKVKVQPPRASRKIGVFATRSPYRPSPIGMSAVEIEKIEGSKIHIRGHDLVNETPILDIKPYLAYADSFPLARQGWIEKEPLFEVELSRSANEALDFLEGEGLTEFRSTLQQQLRFHPTNKKKKRVRSLHGSPFHYEFSYRTWRVHFELPPDNDQKVLVHSITSGYSAEELALTQDPYHDKSLHHKFLKRTEVSELQKD